MKKNFLWLVCLLFSIAIFQSSCGVSKKITHEPIAREVRILAVNDIHAALDDFPRLAFMVDSLRGLYPDLLLISGGDNQTGHPVNDQYPEKGMPMVLLMNKLGFNLSALGNHEFDVSAPQLIKNIKASNFDYISANLVYKDNSHPLKQNKVMVLPNGLRIAFSSVLFINSGGYPDCHPMHTEGFTFLEPITTAKEQLSLKNGNDLLIFVNHFGFSEDVKLANQLPQGAVDLIIGGHSHTRVDKEQVHNGIMITQAENKLKYATLITITIHPDGRIERNQELLKVAKSGRENPEIKEFVERLKNESGLNVPIATTEQGIHSKEHLGYLMADSQRAIAKADVALINQGGVRISELPEGQITMMDIFTLDPFGNEIIAFEMTGHEIREMLINAAQFDGNSPFIPSGIHLRYVMGTEEDDTAISDIELLTTDNKPLDLDVTYNVVMNNYIATVYSFSKKQFGKNLYVVTANATIDWLKQLGQAPDYSQEKRIFISE